MAPTPEQERRPVRRALVSVSDKSGLEDLGRALADAGVEVVSTGSTAARLREAGVDVVAVADVTGQPEVLDGRVKTLHPRVHAGLLADPRSEEHAETLASMGVEPFDLLVVNLYPFRETVASGAGTDAVVENVDIGGPAMVRAGAKNFEAVAVVVEPEDYAVVHEALRDGGTTRAQRARLAARAYAHTAAYDAAVAGWFASVLAPDDDAAQTGLPEVRTGLWRRQEVLRYGENPHQAAALYVADGAAGGPAAAQQLHGKQMSYNNWVDTDAAWRAAHDHGSDVACVAVVKHTNPCGVAVADDVAAAHRAAHACDPVSAFGGVIATNRPVSVRMAEQVAEVFTEVVAAPDFEDGAVEVLSRKPSVRLLVLPSRDDAAAGVRGLETRAVLGDGLLVQQPDRLDAAGDDPSTWTLACGEAVVDDVLADLAFAWRACRAVKSNAVLLASGGAAVGVGMGQVNRVDSARLAVSRAGDRARGAVAASDAFFPFPDGLQVLLDAGVAAVVQPGGSVRDTEVTAAAEAAGVPLYLTGVRHFTH